MSNAILIRFGDNDFATTWLRVLESASSSPEFFKIKDKKKLAFMLSKAAAGMYVLHQNRCEYNGLENLDETDFKSTASYLEIDESRIYLDEEVDQYLISRDWDNSETFYVYEGQGAESI